MPRSGGELRWRFERDANVELAMTMLRCSNPWLNHLAQSAPSQCSLDAQAVLLSVSTGAVPLLGKAAALEGASGAPPESSNSQPESATPSSTPLPVAAPTGALLPTPAQKTVAGNRRKRKREIPGQ